MNNLSLQKAFETHKRDLIDRSMRRQDIIQSRAQERNQEAEFKRQHYEILMQQKIDKQEAELKVNIGVKFGF